MISAGNDFKSQTGTALFGKNQCADSSLTPQKRPAAGEYSCECVPWMFLRLLADERFRWHKALPI